MRLTQHFAHIKFEKSSVVSHVVEHNHALRIHINKDY